tara:strand:- start:2648 stop:4120 length:1473 start_codon:yes stop_codon:yes gene_type:complete
MRRGLFAVLLVFSMALAGCLGPSTASWGSGSGELHVDFSQESTTIKSGLGSETLEMSNIEGVGCSSETGILSANNSGTVSFSGYLAASHFYSSHSSVGGANGIDYAVATSVAIEQMTVQSANSIVEGDGSRIDVKNWDMPLSPETGAGSVDLDEVDRDSDTRWYILGLIPTTENIHNGLTALDEWHQSVTIHGYLMQTNESGNSPGYYNYQTAKEDCSLDIGMQNRESVYVFVTSIELDGATISSNGESNDEWVYGDVPLFGRAGYILFFLAFGIGGGVGAFILSKMFVMQGAKSTMKTLLGKAGMESIKQVKKDAKLAKESGLVSPSQRKADARKQASKQKTEDAKKSYDEPELAGFDLDSVLSSSPSMGSTSEFGGGSGSSVVETIESQEMEREISEQSSVVPSSSMQSPFPPRQSSSSVTSTQPARQQREHYTSSAPVKKSAGPPKKKTVRKRKAAPPQREPAVEEPKQPVRDQFDEPEEEFSDFSF